jgi:hypothetical protein
MPTKKQNKKYSSKEILQNEEKAEKKKKRDARIFVGKHVLIFFFVVCTSLSYEPLPIVHSLLNKQSNP